MGTSSAGRQTYILREMRNLNAFSWRKLPLGNLLLLESDFVIAFAAASLPSTHSRSAIADDFGKPGSVSPYKLP